MRVLVALVFVFGVSGCAHDVHIRYPSPPDTPTGTIVLLLSSAASGVSVAIEGFLVVEDEHTDRIVITNVPIGTQELVMTANGASNAMKVWVGGDHATTIPLGIPDATPGFLKTIVGTVVSLLAYSLINR
jgi:hypothetical protein